VEEKTPTTRKGRKKAMPGVADIVIKSGEAVDER